MESGIIIHPHELTDNMTEMIKAAGIKCLGLHPIGGNVADKTLSDYLETYQTPDFVSRLNKVRGYGISIENEMHALSFLLPRSLFTSHPDWFRQDECGKRVPDINMCPSNKDALEFISERAAYISKIMTSDTERYYFWVDDASGNICHCDKCKNLNESDQALIIYNAILKGLRRNDSKAKQSFLAYSTNLDCDNDSEFKAGTLITPKYIQPENGIFLEFAPMRRNTLINFNTSPENKRFTDRIDSLLKFFGSNGSQVLEYWMDNSLHSNWTKPPKQLKINTEVIKNDIDFYKAKGFEKITSFGCYLSDDYTELYGTPPLTEYANSF